MDCQVSAFGLVLPHDWICPPSAPVSAEKPFCAFRLQTTSNKGSLAARAPGHTRRYRRVSQFVEYLVPYPRRKGAQRTINTSRRHSTRVDSSARERGGQKQWVGLSVRSTLAETNGASFRCLVKQAWGPRTSVV